MKKLLHALSILVFLLVTLVTATLAAPPSDPRFIPVQEIQTPGGLTFWLIEDHKLPLIALEFAFQGAGAVNETPATQGLARLLSGTLDEGAGPYDSRAFQAELENNSISLSFSASRDHFFGSLKMLTEMTPKATELLKLSLTAPRLNEADVKRMIEANLTRIRSNQPDPEWLAARLMNDKAFGAHPYGLNSGGTLSTLPTLTPAKLRAFKDQLLTRDRLKIALVGDITPDQAQKMIDDLFGALPLEEKTKRPSIAPAPIQNIGQTFLFKKEIPQTTVLMIGPAPKAKDPDEAAFIVLNNILGESGFGSRLMEQIREKAGLTYGIYSAHNTMDHTAFLAIQSSMANENTARALEMVRTEIRNLLNAAPPTEKELKDAQGYLLGSMPMALTSTDSIAGLLLNLQLEGRGVDGLDKLRAALGSVRVADLKRAAQKWLDPQGFMTVMIGSPTGIDNAQVVEKINNIE